ncbi:MAG: CPBP family intramembrane glutamic endopeptidase [Frankiaceae bacterium]
MPGPVAHAVETATVAWLVVGAPLAGRLRYRALAMPGPGTDRSAFYRRTLARQWLLTGVVVLAVLASGVAPGDIGLAVHLRAALSLAPEVAELVVVALLVALVLRRQARRRPDRAWAERLLRPVAALLPRTAPERRAFAVLAVTAGITEEVLYRGIVTLWFAQTWPWLGLGGALAASSVAFGLAHSYQGRAGMLLTGGAGYALGVMYAATGSLLVPMLVHAFIDLRVLLVLPSCAAPAPALTSGFVQAMGYRPVSAEGPPST